ncbi:MAG: short-chain dehydrogenase/reductase [Crocinitomicaceae bacterium]|jgi:NADP-dependent 3-hydroxy acid dehydrogenase YdfG|nr:short-chain dehydrogenase/reductase [Crocinitomicaceae bacterium]
MEDLTSYLPTIGKTEGKIVLITGGTTGIGRATALYLAELGAKVMIVGRHEKELEDALSDLKKINENNVFGMIVDVADQKGVEKIFQALDHRFGKLDVLINNAAIAYESVMDGSHDDRVYAVGTNITSYLLCAQEAAVRMKENGSGHIVNVGSMSAEGREGGSSLYVATKSAIQGFSVSLQKELNPHHIKVSLIEPGATATDMQGPDAEELKKKVEAEKMLDASDIAAAIVYCLCQPNRCNVSTMQVEPIMKDEK